MLCCTCHAGQQCRPGQAACTHAALCLVPVPTCLLQSQPSPVTLATTLHTHALTAALQVLKLSVGFANMLTLALAVMQVLLLLPPA